MRARRIHALTSAIPPSLEQETANELQSPHYCSDVASFLEFLLCAPQRETRDCARVETCSSTCRSQLLLTSLLTRTTSRDLRREHATAPR